LYPRWGEFLATGRNPSARAALDVTDRISAPVLHVSMWHDFFQASAFKASAFKAFGRLHAGRGDQNLIVLDGTHYDIDDPELWPTKPMFAWFDHWLKGDANGADAWPTVQYVLAGQPEGPLRSSPVWPPAGTVSTASTLSAPPRALTTDSAAPAPALGGSHLTVSSGMEDQQGDELPAAALMLGTAEAVLTVLESGTGDMVVKLVDRRPDGEVRLLREAVVTLAGVGTVSVSFAPLAYEFGAGSAPGLVVAGASLPAYRSDLPALAGTVRLGGATLLMPLATL
jgi:predicted acyl esterase